MNILVAPTIKLNETVISEVGTRVEIHCEASGSPKPEVKWFLEGPTDRVYTKEQSLFITSVKPEDKREYTCLASNSEGSVAKSTTLDVLCKSAIFHLKYFMIDLSDPPTISISRQPDSDLIYGTSTRLECLVDANPSAEVSSMAFKC